MLELAAFRVADEASVARSKGESRMRSRPDPLAEDSQRGALEAGQDLIREDPPGEGRALRQSKRGKDRIDRRRHSSGALATAREEIGGGEAEAALLGVADTAEGRVFSTARTSSVKARRSRGANFDRWP